MRALIFLLCFASLFASANDWSLELENDGIVVHVRPVEGSKYQEFRSSITVDAGIPEIVALLKDNSACSKWLLQCEHSELLKQVSPSERYFYQISDLPFPVKSRDAIFHASTTFESDKAVIVSMVAVPDYSPATKLVRIQQATSKFRLEILPNNKTRIVWQQHVDPAGAIPSWLVNSMMTDMPYKSLQSIRQLVNEPPYKNAKFVMGENGNPIDVVTNLTD